MYKTLHYISIFIFVLSLPVSGNQESLKEFNKIAFDIHKKSDGKFIVEQIEILKQALEANKRNQYAKELIPQLLAEQYSYLGEHKKSLSAMSEANMVGRRKGVQLSKSEAERANTFEFSQYVVKDAYKEILNNTQDKQIVMFNEGHHVAQHRVMPLLLLEGLWKQGFRYLAVESLSKTHVPENEVYSKHGTYVNEPIFALFLEKAHKLGFVLVSYDSSGKDREETAAKTIIDKIFLHDEAAKVLIHCGYGHINENNMLAGILKSKLYIDPFTINQTTISEGSDIQSDISIYKRIINASGKENPFLLVDNNNQFYSANSKKFDVSLFWPETVYKMGRPTWAMLDRDLLKIKDSWCNGIYPCVLEVYESENIDVVPSDRVFIESNKEKMGVFVGDQSLLIVTKSSDGRILKKIKII